jgi:hypothetical protein
MRKCGDCQLCCKLLPVRELGKGANQRCRHQRFAKGCAVYRQSGMPASCALWNCRWLVGDDTADLPRPDHSHYVIDIMPEFITLRNNETGEKMPFQVVQIWLDPKFPDAYRDPRLRTYLLRRGREGIIALIRFNASDGMTLWPPQITGNGWVECRDNHEIAPEHSAAEIVDTLSRLGSGPP